MKIETLKEIIHDFLVEHYDESNPDFQKEVIIPLNQYFKSIEKWET